MSLVEVSLQAINKILYQEKNYGKTSKYKLASEKPRIRSRI